MWLKNFKIAIVQKDLTKINQLLDEMPHFEDLEEMKEASYLTQEALQLVTSLKNSDAEEMKQLQKNIKFLKSTQRDTPAKLDIKS